MSFLSNRQDCQFSCSTERTHVIMEFNKKYTTGGST